MVEEEFCAVFSRKELIPQCKNTTLLQVQVLHLKRSQSIKIEERCLLWLLHCYILEY